MTQGCEDRKEGNTYKRYGGTVLTKVVTKRLTTDTLRSSLENRRKVVMRTSNVNWPVVARMKGARMGSSGCSPKPLHVAIKITEGDE